LKIGHTVFVLFFFIFLFIDCNLDLKYINCKILFTDRHYTETNYEKKNKYTE